ncbi:MAG TPA: recombination protein RecR [Candidatus Yonathbacteria bacterium]|nr:recombination protein RecR [Candidatus Yonathbacteria bacterium]
MSNIDTLAQLFMKFPGIGTRQAKRFVYFLLAQNPSFVDTLAKEISELQKNITQCTSCFRFYPRVGESADSRLGRGLCSVCVDDADSATLMVVEKDTDFDSVRRSGSYAGRYFILGGTIPVLEKDPASKIRIRELLERIEGSATDGLTEIILALSVNPEGDFTRDYVSKALTPLAGQLGITITTLGRGLSTGTELEYSDGDTLRHALKNRG